MTLRIAFCGPNVPLNESLAIHSRDLIYREDLEFIPIGNPLHQVGQITRREDYMGSDLDWLNLWSSSMRRMTLENYRDQDVLISSSGGLDQVALQAAWLSEQMTQHQTGLVGPDGKPIQTVEQIMATNRSGAVLQVVINSAEYEVMEIFDFSYCVIPAGIATDTPGEILAILAQYDDFLTDIPAFTNIVRLPDNEEAAKDALRNEAEKWRKKLES